MSIYLHPSYPGKAPASRLRWLRMCRGYSQSELAQAVHASRQTIRSIERRRSTPSVTLAISIARVLGTTVEDLFLAP